MALPDILSFDIFEDGWPVEIYVGTDAGGFYEIPMPRCGGAMRAGRGGPADSVSEREFGRAGTTGGHAGPCSPAAAGALPTPGIS